MDGLPGHSLETFSGPICCLSLKTSRESDIFGSFQVFTNRTCSNQYTTSYVCVFLLRPPSLARAGRMQQGMKMSISVCRGAEESDQRDPKPIGSSACKGHLIESIDQELSGSVSVDERHLRA